MKIFKRHRRASASRWRIEYGAFIAPSIYVLIPSIILDIYNGHDLLSDNPSMQLSLCYLDFVVMIKLVRD